MTPSITRAVAFFPKLAADYKWFDKGDIDNGIKVTHQQNMDSIKSPLPFDKCAIVGTDMEGQTYVVLVSQETNGLLLIRGANTMATYNNQRVQFDPVFRINPKQEFDPDGMRIYYEEERFNDNEEAKNITVISIVVLATFLRILEEKQIGTVYAPVPSNNHAKRMRQGKAPLFSWHTVVLEPRSKQESIGLGGTHSSPRLHDVRGHWVVRNNKRFWRKPHKRGDASLGVVFKDYKLKGE